MRAPGLSGGYPRPQDRAAPRSGGGARKRRGRPRPARAGRAARAGPGSAPESHPPRTGAVPSQGPALRALPLAPALSPRDPRMRALVVGMLLLAAAPTVPSVPRIEKLGRILALEDRRASGDGERERYLRDQDRGVRRRAALAAGRIADPALVPTLSELMNDGEPEVRQMSAFALGLIGDRHAGE